MCLAELGNVRSSIFSNVENRVEYMKNFLTQLTSLFTSPIKEQFILKDKLVFKEIVKCL